MATAKLATGPFWKCLVTRSGRNAAPDRPKNGMIATEIIRMSSPRQPAT
jgi:hypothetical protein